MIPDLAVILPARDEEACVHDVVTAFRREAARVVVVDNASSDATAARALAAGAEVVPQPRVGYGAACLRGVEHLRAAPPEFVAFADCDGTLDAADLRALMEPLQSGAADLVLGRRIRLEPRAYPWHQRAGNAAILGLVGLLTGSRLHDIPPLRALRWDALARLQLDEQTYGFPVETVTSASARGLRIQEVDVAYRRRRTGRSKVSGSFRTSIMAGLVMARAAIRAWRRARRRIGTIVVFARAPELGKVKTRLGAALGDVAALRLHRAFLRDTLASARLSGATVVLAHTPAPPFEEQALADVCIEQSGRTFGERFDDALSKTQALHGSQPLLIVGADTPQVSPEKLRSAVAATASGVAVIGPAPRGGFYALGFPGRVVPVAEVFEEALQVPALERVLAAEGLQTQRIENLFDIDEPDDVVRLRGFLQDGGPWKPPATAAALSLLGAAAAPPPP